MKRIKQWYREFILLLLCCALILPGMTVAAQATETTGSAIHGYVEDMVIVASAQLPDPIPGFTFEQAKTEYDNITFYSGPVTPNIYIKVSKENAEMSSLAYQFYVNGNKAPGPIKGLSMEETKIALVMAFSKLQMGTNTLSVRVGKALKNSFGRVTGIAADDYDEYTLSVTLLPGLSEMTIKDGQGENLPISPKFEPGSQIYFTDKFTVFTASETITLNAGFKADKGVQGFIGEGNTMPLTSNQDISLNISDFKTGEDGIAKIPIHLVVPNNEKIIAEKNVYLYVANPEKFKPVITQQQDHVTCDKLETPVLSVKAQSPNASQLSYQWYGGETESTLKTIDGATEPSYKVPSAMTDRARTYYYCCEVTDTFHSVELGEIHFTERSAAVKLDVQLSYVSKPKVLQELGSFQDSKDNSGTGSGISTGIYKTNYTAGEKFDRMPIRVRPAEDGCQFTFEFYSAKEPDFNEAELIDGIVETGYHGSNPELGSYETYSIRPNKGYEAGVYYIYCKVISTAEDGRSASTISGPVRLEFVKPTLVGFKGEGTEANPYLIESEADFARIRELVFDHQWCSGIYFKMTQDVTLSDTWEPIGVDNPEHEYAPGYTIQCFGGILDGDGHILRYAKGSKPLFNYTSDATIKNLKIHGEEIDGDGLIDQVYADYGSDGDYWTGVPACVTLDNVTLLSGSSTKGSGFLHGSGSGMNIITIRNCTVEEGVTIGYTKDQDGVGSFVGAMLNGYMDNCVSHANVYGKNAVGGLAGGKGQAVGPCIVRNSSFFGTVEATGDCAGGIIAEGYVSDSAPQTMPVSVINCLAVADVTGGNMVGGILGGEPGAKGPMNSADITSNVFYGTVKATRVPADGEKTNAVGGIVGYFAGPVPELIKIQNNYYYETDGKTSPALGGYGKVLNATEEQKQEYLDNMGYAKTAEEFKNGTVLKSLNEGSPYKNWTQGEQYPVLSTKAVVYDLELSGTYKTEYVVGENLDFSGMQVRALYTDGRRELLSMDQVKLTGFDSSKHGMQEVNIEYQGAQKVVRVTVLKAGNEDITVYFTLLGDKVHGETGGVHTLHDNNLTTWVGETEYTVDQNATVKDVIDQAATTNSVTVRNPSGNYIEAITYKDVTLAEFSNGPQSGWMYTLNGVHPDLGIAEQYLNDQDVIVLHYTDDYTLEKDEGGSSKPETGEDATDEDILKAYQDTGDKQAAKTPETGSIGGEWLALGLARAEHEMTPAFKQAYLEAVTTFVNDNYKNGKLDANKSTENSRVILALTALGEDPATFVEGKNLLTGLADFDWVKQQGINGPIWALIALDSQNYEIPASSYLTKTTRTLLVDYILNSQEAGGGWATEDHKIDTDMTAMAIQALAPYAKTNPEVKSALDKAIAKLSKMQDASTGAFKNSQDKLNAESTAQVVVALTAMGINPNTDSRFMTTVSNLSVMDGLMRFYDGKGQFKHEVGGKANEMATEQSYYALAAYFRFHDKKTALYDMTDLLDTYDVKVQPGKNGTVTVTPQKAQEGQTVTVQVKPDTGYELEKLMIDGIEKTVDQNGKVTFVMPANAVTVTASFKQTDRAVEQVAAAMDELRLSSYSASKENYEALQKVENAYNALTAEQKQQLKQEYPDAFDNYEKQRTRFEDAREAKLERYTGKLEDALNKYDQKEYSDENWEKLQDLYADAQDQLLDAPHADAMTQIVEDFKKAAKEVPSGADLNVTFRLIGDSKHENADEHTSYVTWIETTDYQLEAGSTVYDLFVEAMDDANLNYKGADSNYVSSIQAPDVLGGYWLSEFDNGKNSGWMYTVNGKHPDYGLKDWELEDEDVVIWHYVDDYAKEENRGTWLEAKDISPEEYVERNLDEILKIGKHGDVDPDEITMKDLGKDITFKFIPNKGYEVKSVTIDGEKKGKIKEYKYKDLSIYSRIEVEFCEEGAMDFDDVRLSDWFYDDVQYAVSAGLFNGTGENTFSPNHPMTRAMLVTVLYRLEGEPEVEDYADFIDVGHHEWYTDAVAWASDNDIVNGVGNDQFAPNNNITREQMAAILYRYADYKDYDISDSNSLTGYSDYSQISVYALKPLKWANAEGLINGRTETTLAPTGTATRAEVAAILHRFVENVVE